MSESIVDNPLREDVHSEGKCIHGWGWRKSWLRFVHSLRRKWKPGTTSVPPSSAKLSWKFNTHCTCLSEFSSSPCISKNEMSLTHKPIDSTTRLFSRMKSCGSRYKRVSLPRSTAGEDSWCHQGFRSRWMFGRPAHIHFQQMTHWQTYSCNKISRIFSIQRRSWKRTVWEYQFCSLLPRPKCSNLVALYTVNLQYDKKWWRETKTSKLTTYKPVVRYHQVGKRNLDNCC
jgi:hypothetical protein